MTSPFVIHKQLATGRFVNVYQLGTHDQGTFILKILDTSTADAEKTKAEVESVLDLKHPHVQQCCSYSFDSDRKLYLLLQEVKWSLQHELEKRNFKWNDDFKLLAQMADGLKFLHSKNVCHGHLRTDHVYLDMDRNIKLGEVAIVRKPDNLTKPVMFYELNAGRPCYLGPEVIDHKPYTTKTDVWSLGCIFLEILSQKAPFIYGNLAGITSGVHPKISTLRHGLPLSNLIDKMLAVEPSMRSTAAEVCDTLKDIRGMEVVSADVTFLPRLYLDWGKVYAALAKYRHDVIVGTKSTCCSLL
ncbi:serine/threonine-protein kinase Nek3-like [Physella acuta]|uniref:serine/threonine-protein kinase Nek3-like n=1 Tax=Physella acuta TaxID=109671 RepID=UPI0027DB01BE|nr:serine/threonine-protein kinase Nek3-like [Physella acuta]